MRSVHAAHAVDRDLLDQRLLDQGFLRGGGLLEDLGVGLGRLGHGGLRGAASGGVFRTLVIRGNPGNSGAGVPGRGHPPSRPPSPPPPPSFLTRSIGSMPNLDSSPASRSVSTWSGSSWSACWALLSSPCERSRSRIWFLSMFMSAAYPPRAVPIP